MDAKLISALSQELVCGFDGEPLDERGKCVYCGTMHSLEPFNAVLTQSGVSVVADPDTPFYTAVPVF